LELKHKLKVKGEDEDKKEDIDETKYEMQLKLYDFFCSHM